MPSTVDDGGGTYQKRLHGIYWSTFVGFVSNGKSDADCERADKESRRIKKREGSFEYMELTAKDNVSLQSETDSCSSNENSSSDLAKEDRSSSSNGSLYVVLDMHRKREIHINDEIAIFDGSPIRRHSSFPLTRASVPDSPKCSPIMHEHLSSAFHGTFSPSPILGSSQVRMKTLNNINKDEAILSDVDSSYEDIYYQNQNTSAEHEQCIEKVPWKDHSLAIQRWMVPRNGNYDDDDEFIAIPDSIPEFDFCHYTPTLEVIMEENEDSEEDASLHHKHELNQDSISLNGTDIVAGQNLSGDAGWHSANDLSHCSGCSQDDLYSIISTCGSLGSLRRMNTLENLSFDESPDQDSVGGSSDEYDRYQGDEMILHDGLSSAKQELTPSKILLSLTRCRSISPSSNSSSKKLSASQEAIPSSSISSIPDCESDLKSNCSTHSSLQSLERSPVKTEGLNNDYPIEKEDKNESHKSSAENLTTENQDEADDFLKSENQPVVAKSVPQIVIALVNEENDEQSNTYPRNTAVAKVKNHAFSNGQIHRYHQRLDGQKTDPESSLVLKNASHQRIAHIKIADSSRISAMSSSTPELSAMTEDALLYIPVSYASEAAAIKKKRKRRATISANEVLGRRNAASKALQTKTIISGSGLKFGTLKKKFSRRSTGNSLRRSDSDKPKIYYSNPEVTSPTTPQIDTLVRPASAASASSAQTVGGARRKSLRTVVSNIFRRLSGRFSAQNTATSKTKSARKKEDVPAPTGALLLIKEESSTSDSISVYSSAKGSEGTSSMCNEMLTVTQAKQCRIQSDTGTCTAHASTDDFRYRSHSMPTRPRSSPAKHESDDSDVFLSQGNGDDCSLDRTVYV